MKSKFKILIVEDEVGFRRTFVDLFRHFGHEVVEAEDGKIGWEKIQTESPDVVLLDLVMPGMNGFEVLDKVRQTPATKNIPVIVFSVLGEQTDIQKALDAGADDYIIKGFYTPSEVLKKIGTFMAERQRAN